MTCPGAPPSTTATRSASPAATTSRGAFPYGTAETLWDTDLLHDFQRMVALGDRPPSVRGSFTVLLRRH